MGDGTQDKVSDPMLAVFGQTGSLEELKKSEYLCNWQEAVVTISFLVHSVILGTENFFGPNHYWNQWISHSLMKKTGITLSLL